MLSAQVGKLLSSCVRTGAANITAPVRQGAIKAGAALFAGLLAIAAFGCVTAAIWIFAVPYVGLAGGALIAAAYLLFAGLAVVGMVAWIIQKQTRPIAPNPAEQISPIINQLFKEQKGTLLVAALVAGIMAADNQRKR